MTPTEWEIITLGLIEKLKKHYRYIGTDYSDLNDVKEFIKYALEAWREGEKNAKV